MLKRGIWVAVALVLAALTLQCSRPPKPGTVLDEAARARMTPIDLIKPTDDYFAGMDYNVVGRDKTPVTFSQAEIEGRNMWMVWTGGDDRLWDTLAVDSFGSFDLLKTISSHPDTSSGSSPSGKAYGQGGGYCGGAYGRHNRWECLGLVNEPCFTEATAPDPNHFGLWVDVRDPKCRPDPFADAVRYPGIKVGARGTTVPVGSYYGEPTGIVGLRLFPNPDFDEGARRRWNSERYYNEPTYYYDKSLVRPYRVGMSCAFCHVGPNPLRPPQDANAPEWSNLSANVGAQYFWWDSIFNWKGKQNESSFLYQALHTSRPGTLDTSLVSTDNINNPRSMNAVYYLRPRLAEAKRWHKEFLQGGERDNVQLNNFVPAGDPLAQFFTPPNTVWTPRVLKDGSDSVGVLGALNRVYLNIGLFSEEWLLHFRPLIGGQEISPIRVIDARRNSVYWQATELQTPKMAQFFLASTDPHRLEDAPGGSAYLTEDAATVRRGKIAFAERCARCHSSKFPPLPAGIDLESSHGPNYLAVWNTFWDWTKTEAFKAQMRPIVLADDFRNDNYLSTELRVPITLLGINACSPLATNAIANNIWDNFSSSSYKSLPSVGTITIRDPRNGSRRDYPLPAGGRGYIRPASLVSLWSTAPFLQNNSVGPFNPSPSVAARMDSFQKSIEQMLWPERREKDEVFVGNDERGQDKGGPGEGIIDRLTQDSYIEVSDSYIPEPLRGLLEFWRRVLPFAGTRGFVKIGPFPKGMPVSLITSMDLLGADLQDEDRKAHRRKLLELFRQAQQDLKPGANLGKVIDDLFPQLFELSKCKDYVVNKGHYFGTGYMTEEPGLGDDDKRALIAFLKTL